MTPARPAKTNILTVALEDYFQVGAFNRVIQQGQWYRFENRLEKNTRRLLDLLARNNLKATVFVLGWIADRFPELIKLVVSHGHEIASKGYYHRGIKGLTPIEFKEDLIRSREALERAGGRKVVGYRLADGWFTPEDMWAMESLAEVGYEYDSSIAPIGDNFTDDPLHGVVHRQEGQHGGVWEVPISTGRILGLRVPIAGGNYLRQIPNWLVRRAVGRWMTRADAPLVVYFHAWELDPDQPKITATSRLTRLRHYRNLHKMEGYLENLFQRYSFTSAADYLGLSTELTDCRFSQKVVTPADTSPAPAIASGEIPKPPVTIVVPCFNEELILPYLGNTLKSVEEKLGRKYRIEFVLVDDGSTDRTWEGLNSTFATTPNVSLYRHERNRGVTAAIMTGLSHAKTEIVCSIDCDCTYDPHQLEGMIPMLAPGVDLVTASPYHPEGLVRNVPGWRLRLSRGASWCYRRILRQKLHTYTSCFRVYRRSKTIDIPLTYGSFLGIAELIGRMDLAGSTVVEYPAVLEVRMLGRSKMKTVSTILGHLKLMASLARQRFFGPKPPAPTEPSEVVAETPIPETREIPALLLPVEQESRS